MEDFNYRLCNLKLHLKWWNRHIFGNINTQVDILERDLADVERQLHIQWMEDTWEQRIRVGDQLDEAVRRQEMYYLQKSCIHWLKEGDRNTCFFHASIAHRTRSAYTALLEVYDQMLLRMQEARLDYFRTFLASEPIELSEDLLSSILPLVMNQETLEITRILTRKEIRDLIFAMGRNRSPGSDGFSTDFFVSC